MTREEKIAEVEALKQNFEAHDFFYITDASTLTVEQVNDFRRECFNNNVTMKVSKNTLIKRALDSFEGNYSALIDALHGPTAILFTETANAPAKIMKEFRENFDKPVLKVAYIESEIYEGDDKINALAELKSKEELLGDVILLLQSPVKNVISALQSGGNKISGLLTALEEKAEAS